MNYNITTSPKKSSQIRHRNDLQDLKAALSERMPALCESLGRVNPQRQGNEYRYGTNGSLSAIVAGPDAGRWYDHEAAQGGGPIDLIIHDLSIRFVDAVAYAENWIGGNIDRLSPVKHNTASHRADKSKTTEYALKLWGKGKPLDGTVGEAYLRNRSIYVLPDCSVARFTPSLNYTLPNGDEPVKGSAPAIMSIVRNIHTGKPQGLQRRYLDQWGRKHSNFNKAMSLGVMKQGAIMLTGMDAPKGLNLVEGFEDGLSLLDLGFADCGGIWATCGTSGLANFPLVDRIERLRIIADKDQAGMSQARACVERWRKCGKVANWTTPPEGKDVNEYLQTVRKGAA